MIKLKTHSNVLLIRPPIEEAIPDISSYTPNFFALAALPTALLRIGALLKSKGHKVSLLDCATETNHPKSSIYRRTFIGTRNTADGQPVNMYHFGMTYEDIENELNEHAPDTIMLSCNITHHWKPAHKVVEMCKQIFPNARIIMGGIYPTLCPEHAKKSGAEIFEGELTEANNFDADLSLLDYVPDYMVLKTTRGCPNNCSYCAVHLLEGRKIRCKDVDTSLNEIINANKEFGIKKFMFWESNILANRKHFEELLDKIINVDIEIELHASEGLPPELLKPDLLQKMKKAGFKRFSLPLESTSENMLTRFHRRPTNLDFENAVKNIANAGYDIQEVKAYILVGLPKQPLDTIIDTFITAWKLKLKPRFMAFSPIPGSEEFENHKNIIDPRLEQLHPFLWPFAGNDLSAVELNSIVEYHSISDPFNFLSQKKINDIDRRFIQRIKQSPELMSRLGSMSDSAHPDTTIVNALHLINGKVLIIGADECDEEFLKEKGFDVTCFDDNEDNSKQEYDTIIDIGYLQAQEDISGHLKTIKNVLSKNGLYILKCFSEVGNYSVRFTRTLNSGKNPFLSYLNKDRIKKYLKDFQISRIKEVNHVVVDDRLRPGVYEVYSHHAFVMNK